MINYRTDRRALIELGDKEHETYAANAPTAAQVPIARPGAENGCG